MLEVWEVIEKNLLPELKQALGVRLLDRNANGIEPTSPHFQVHATDTATARGGPKSARVRPECARLRPGRLVSCSVWRRMELACYGSASVSLIGKFDGEFASHSFTYPGTGTCAERRRL